MEKSKKATEIAVNMTIYVPVSSEKDIPVQTLGAGEIENLIPELGNLLDDAGYAYQIWTGEAQND